MMNSKAYQNISKYDGTLNGRKDENYKSTLYGTPEWRGIEYDWEAPGNGVVGSPGGISTIHHHPTHGFNGRGNMSYDIYGGQGERYNSGVYGNLYQSGQESSQVYFGNPPPDYQYWQNSEPSQFSYTHSQEATFAPSMQMYEGPGSFESTPIESVYQIPQGSQEIEKYTSLFKKKDNGDDFELLDRGPETQNTEGDIIDELEEDVDELEEDVDELKEDVDELKEDLEGLDISGWQVFGFLILSLIVVEFWAETSLLFVKQTFHNGRSPSWQRSACYSVLVTIIFVAIVLISGDPLSRVVG